MEVTCVNAMEIFTGILFAVVAFMFSARSSGHTLMLPDPLPIAQLEQCLFTLVLYSGTDL